MLKEANQFPNWYQENVMQVPFPLNFLQMTQSRDYCFKATKLQLPTVEYNEFIVYNLSFF